MKLIQFKCDGDEYTINLNMIKHIRASARGGVDTIITFLDSEEMVLEHEIENVIEAIGEACPSEDSAYMPRQWCVNEIEKLKRRIRNLEYHPAVQ